MLTLARTDFGYSISYAHTHIRVDDANRAIALIADAIVNDLIPVSVLDQQPSESVKLSDMVVSGQQVRLMSEEDVEREFGLRFCDPPRREQREPRPWR